MLFLFVLSIFVLPGLKGPRNFLMFDCSSVHMSLKPMHHIIFISVKVQFSLNSKIKEGKEKKKTDGTHAECEAQARLRPKVWS